MFENSAGEIARKIRSLIKIIMKSRAKTFKIKDVSEEEANKRFTINFEAYNYFLVGIRFNNGKLSTYVYQNDKEETIEGLTADYEKSDLFAFIKHLETELALRIPEKYLEAKSWV